MNVRPGDLVTVVHPEWVWPTPELWRAESDYAAKFTAESQEIALVLAVIIVVVEHNWEKVTVMLAIRGDIGWVRAGDIERC